MFDQFVVVDWSAHSSPKRGGDSIWIARCDGDRTNVENHATRRSAERRLGEIVDAGGGRRTLVGVDFSLGYPAGTAAALGFGADPWQSTISMLAELVDDDDRNANNRFEVAAGLNARISGRSAPFWGCPPARVGPMLRPTKPRSFGPLGEWRIVEERLRRTGWRPFSSWQLLGAGAVGSQTLLGLPTVCRLLGHDRDRVHVWPFTTGLDVPEIAAGTVVIAELWPSMLPTVVAEAEDGDMVRDEVQVRVAAAWLASAAAAGTIAGLFAPELTAAERCIVEREEGWILGVPG